MLRAAGEGIMGKHETTSGKWSRRHVESLSCRLLSDHPDSPPILKCLFEQDKVAAYLKAAIWQSLKRPSKHEKSQNSDHERNMFAFCRKSEHRKSQDNDETTHVFALYGKYGQGKSRVIDKVLNDLEQKNNFRKYKKFTVFDHGKESLLRDFDIFVSDKWSKFKSISFLILSTLIVVLLIYIVGYFLQTILKYLTTELNILTGDNVANDYRFAKHIILKFLDTKLNITIYESLKNDSGFVKYVMRVFVPSILFSLPLAYAGWAYFARDWNRKILFGKFKKNDIVQWFCSLVDLRGFATLIIIDDLDRAPPDQQRAFLLALNKHKHDAGKVFLVAFDEEPLLARGGDAPNPAELLDKTFDASFRMAPMNVEDAVMMACAFLQAIWLKNPLCPWARRLNDPQITGDLARMLYLHGSASARCARRVVNNLYMDVLRLRPRDYNDISALIRLAGIFQYVPAVESDLEFMISHLNQHDDTSLIKSVKQRFPDALDETRETELKTFLVRTRHMKPEDGYWGYVLRISDRHLYIKRGESLDEDWRKMDSPACTGKFRLEWALMDVSAAAETSPLVRKRAYHDMRKGVRPDIRREESRGAKELYEELLELIGAEPVWGKCKPGDEELLRRALASRIMAHDGACLRCMKRTEFVRLIENYEKDCGKIGRSFPPILFFTDKKGRADKKGRRIWASPEQAILHLRSLGASMTAPKGYKLQDNIQLMLRHSRGTPYLTRYGQYTTRLLSPGDIVSAIELAWPDFQAGSASDELTEEEMRHFTALGRILPQLGRSQACLPNAHKHWLAQRLRDGHLEAVFSALTLLVPKSQSDTSRIWCDETRDEITRLIEDIVGTDFRDFLGDKLNQYSSRAFVVKVIRYYL